MRKLNILSITINETIGAQAYYRFLQANQELASKNLIDFRYTHVYRNDYIDWADIVLMQRIPFYVNISTVGKDGEVRVETENYALSAVDYIKRTGKILIMDFDDNTFEVMEDNPCINSFEDLSMIEIIERILPQLDGVTVTNEFLKDKLQDKVSCDIKVLPNSIKKENWNIKNQKNERITIGWEGGQSHKENLKLLYDVIPAIREKYDNVDFVFFGLVPEFDYFKRKFEVVDTDGGFVSIKIELTDEEKENFNEDRDLLQYDDGVFARKHSTFSDYRETLASLGFDIGLYPLHDNDFSRGKSDLKYLQYSMLGIPTISSDVGVVTEPYTMTVKNNTEDWVKAISELVEDRYYRTEMGNKAKTHVLETRNISDTCMDWYKFYLDTYENVVNKRRKSGKSQVSVILPVYNWKEAIEPTLRSVVNQDYDNFELIVVDDGSVDGTFEVCQEFLADYDNVNLIKLTENSGVSNARNVGIEAATGDYISFIDQDEIYHQGRLARLARFLDDNPDKDMVFCHSMAELLRWKMDKNAYDIVSAKPYNTLMDGQIFVDDKNFVSPTEVMIRKKDDYIFNTELGFGKEDQDLWIRIMQEKEKNIGTIPKMLCTRRIHAENALQKLDSVQAQQWKELDKQFRIKEFTNIPYFMKGTEDEKNYGYNYDVSLIILNYNDTKGVMELINSINEEVSLEVIIVDNNSQDTSVNKITEACKNYDVIVLTIRSGKNIALARNIGLNTSRGKYVYFCESSYRMTDNLLTKLFNIAETDFSVGIVSPVMVDGNDTLQDGVKIKNKDGFLLDVAYEYTEEQEDLYPVFKAPGLIRNRVFEIVGYYDNKLRYNSEDIEFCERLNEAGYRVIVNTGVKVIRLLDMNKAIAGKFDANKTKKTVYSNQETSLVGY